MKRISIVLIVIVLLSYPIVSWGRTNSGPKDGGTLVEDRQDMVELSKEVKKTQKDMEEQTKHNAQVIKDRFRLASDTFEKAATEITKINQDYENQLTSEAELEMIVRLRGVIDNVLEQGLTVPPDILDGQMDKLDNTKVKMHRLATKSIKRNEGNLTYRQNIMKKRKAEWKDLYDKNNAGTLSDAEERNFRQMSRMIKRLHQKIKVNERRLHMFKTIDSRIDAKIDSFKKRWENQKDRIWEYNTDIENLKDTREILVQAEILKDLDMMTTAFAGLELEAATLGAGNIMETMSDPLDSIFTNLGAPDVERPGEAGAEVSSDEVLSIIEQY